jgi:hypothetical protein
MFYAGGTSPIQANSDQLQGIAGFVSYADFKVRRYERAPRHNPTDSAGTELPRPMLGDIPSVAEGARMSPWVVPLVWVFTWLAEGHDLEPV